MRKLQLALQIASGLDYLHTREEPVVHSDIKRYGWPAGPDDQASFMPGASGCFAPNMSWAACRAGLVCCRHAHSRLNACSLNILLDDAGVAKLADFGLAQKLRSTETSPEGRAASLGNTWQWAAPEVLLYGRASRKADVYSFAIVVWEIFTCYGNGKVSLGGSATTKLSGGLFMREFFLFR